MSKRVFSKPYHEVLDATVIIKKDCVSDSRRPAETEASEELFADDSLENTFFDTQDVSAWLEESLFSVQCGEEASPSQAIADDNTAPSENETSKMPEPKDLFSDFESEAPEPPPRPHHRVATKNEPAVAPKVRESNEKLGSETSWQWARALVSSKNVPLIGVSLMALLAVGTIAAFSMTQLEEVENGVEPATLSLLNNAPVTEIEQPSEERYCLSQGIRLGAAVERAASLRASASANLQLLFTEFAQRCGNYQFVPEIYLKTQLDIKADRQELVQQNPSVNDLSQPTTAAMVDQSMSKSSLPALAKSSTSPQLIKNIQWRLVKLGFYKERIDGKGRIDGVYNLETQAAINAFYKKHSEFTFTENTSEVFTAIEKIYAEQ